MFLIHVNSFCVILTAIRSGDYYMFDELEDEDIDLLPEEKQYEDEDRFDRPNIGEVWLFYFFFYIVGCQYS